MLKPAVIPLTGGLDFSNTKTLVEPGKLTDCLNYDTNDTFGYGRVNGFFRWDGAAPIRDMNLFAFEVDQASDLTGAMFGAPLFTVNHRSGVTDSSVQSDSFGIFVTAFFPPSTPTRAWILFLYTDSTKGPTLGDSVNVYLSEGAIAIADEPLTSNVISADAVPEIDLDTEGLLGTILNLFNDYGSLVGHYYPAYNTWAPKWISTFDSDSDGDRVGRGSGTTMMVNLPITGLHYHNDRAYAVTDLLQLTVNYLNNEVLPGDVVYPTGSPSTPLTYYQVVKSTLGSSSSWTGGTSGDTAVVTVRPLYKRASDEFNPEGRNRQSDIIALQNTSIVWAVLRGGNGNCFRISGIYEEASGAEPYTIGNLRKSFSEEQARTSGCLATRDDAANGPSLVVTSGGSGYTTPPRITVTGGGGFGATAVAKLSGAAVGEVVLLNPGYGYTSTPAGLFQPSGGGGTGANVNDAGLWQQQEAGWQYVDHGWLVEFSGGNSPSGYFTKMDRAKLGTSQTTTFTATSTTGTPNTILTTLDFDTAVPQGTFGWNSSATGQIMLGSLVQTDGDGNYVSMYIRDAAMNYSAYIPTIGFVDFNTIMSVIPQNATIRGIQVDVDYETSAGWGSTDVPRFKLKATLFKTSDRNSGPTSRSETRIGGSKEANITVSTGTINTSTTFGGDGDLWSALDLGYDVVKDPNFGVALDLLVTRGQSTTADFHFRIDRVRITVHYNDPSIRYYFNDGAGNTLAGDLVDYVITEGDLRRGDAAGIMQIANLHPIEMTAVTSTSSMTIKKDYEIFISSSLGAGNKVGTVATDMTYNGLPSRKKLYDHKSRYQFMSGNFYANADWESVFGVSGAGRAFEYDGKYFRTIYAINPGEQDSDEKDKPRHIAKHKYRLALGYASGSVLMSSQIDPAEFDGLVGGVEVGIGDKITGLSSLVGSYLAVFCQNSIHGISEEDLQPTVISATSGCIEYSLANTGNNPMFCDSQGISTLEASDKYGDFSLRPMSTAIYPWLLPRLQKSDNPHLGGAGSGLMVAYTIRSKGQYIMWFADGWQLVMGMNSTGDAPMFTLTKYLLPTFNNPYQTTKNNVLGVVRPLALCSQMDDTGDEHVLFSVDLWSIGNLFSSYTPIDYANYVYKANYLWFFDCGVGVATIPAYIQTQFWNKEDPFKNSTVYKARLEGSSKKYAPLKISVGEDYEDAAGTTQDISLHNTTETGLPISPVPRSKIASVKKTARTSTFKIENTTYPSAGFILTVDGPNGAETFYTPPYPTPEHHLQTLLLKYEEGRDDA